MIQYIKEENTIKVKLLPCPIVIKGGDGEQSDWLEEDTESLAYIKNKPTNVSSFNNDVGYLTEHQDLSDYAKTSDLAPVALSDDYDDLQNKPTIPIVNDATITLTQGGTAKGSFTLNQSSDATIDLDAGGVSSVDWSDIQNKPSFATVATSGDYDDLDNKPTIPTVDYPVTDVQVNSSSVVNNKVANITVPTDTGDLTNNAGFITGIDSNDVTTALGYTPGTSNFSGSYTDLTDKPTIPDDLADLNDDSTHRLVTDTEKTTWNNKSDFSGSYNDLTNLPTLPNGTYIGTSTNWGQNTGVSYLRTSYFQYNQVPQKKGDLVYSTGTRNLHVCGDVVWDSNQNCYKTTPVYIGNFAAPVNADWNSDSGLSQILNKPTIPANTSDLNNDSGFITTETDPTVPAWAKAANKPTYTASEVGALPDTTTIPTNTSDLNNDSGFITSESDPVFSASAAAGISSSDISNWNGKTSNIGTITEITMNGTSKGTSGNVDLGTVITSETQLSKGTTTGSGNAVTDISVNNHQITLTKGKTFLESYTETDPIFSASAAAGISSTDINNWDGKQDPATTLSGYGITDASISNRTVTLGSNSVYVPNILSGNSAPTSGQGSDGDLYLQLV